MKNGDARPHPPLPRGELPGIAPPDPELVPGFELLEPEHLACPLVFCSPHSGSVYPRRFLGLTRLDPLMLRRSEDAHVDRLFAAVPAVGAPLLRAHFPRAYLDVNREAYELDPRMFDGRLPGYANTLSLRVAGGLGTIARLVGESQEIYTRRLPVAEAMARIEGLYKPFHHLLRRTLDRSVTHFGACFLVDCHSMPSSAVQTDAQGKTGEMKLKSDFIIGDRFGTSCEPFFADAIEYELRRLGYAVARNKPYAGGFITEHYGNPLTGWHAAQIEINRALYMDEKTLEPNAHFSQLAQDLGTLAQFLAEVTMSRLNPRRAAAE